MINHELEVLARTRVRSLRLFDRTKELRRDCLQPQSRLRAKTGMRFSVSMSTKVMKYVNVNVFSKFETTLFLRLYILPDEFDTYVFSYLFIARTK